jgi:hypothetical protein
VEPWNRFQADHRVVFLGELIAWVSDLALRAPEDEGLCRRTLQAAARHGKARRKQDLPDTLLFAELGIVRQAISTYVQEHYDGTSDPAVEALVRLDMALSLAAKAALRGYHRSIFERRRVWPQVMDDLAGEWNPPVLAG